MKRILLSTVLFTIAAFAQRPFVRATGEGVVSFIPDLVSLTISVQNSGATAQEAGDANARQTTAVIAAVKQVIGGTGEVKTIGYSITPQYRYPQNADPVLTGYRAVNSIQAKSSDLNLAGRIIDAASGAGATTVGGLGFALKDSNPARREALRLATAQARLSVEAMAAGISGKIGAVVSIEEGFAQRVVGTDGRAAGGVAATAPTPIEAGMLEVRATVTLEAELFQ